MLLKELGSSFIFYFAKVAVRKLKIPNIVQAMLTKSSPSLSFVLRGIVGVKIIRCQEQQY